MAGSQAGPVCVGGSAAKRSKAPCHPTKKKLFNGGTAVALKYGDINRFVREHGKVTALAKKGAVTLLKNGKTDSVAFFEKDAVKFKHNGKTYSRKEFEELVRDD